MDCIQHCYHQPIRLLLHPTFNRSRVKGDLDSCPYIFPRCVLEEESLLGNRLGSRDIKGRLDCPVVRAILGRVCSTPYG
jgi:hypothetical protein